MSTKLSPELVAALHNAPDGTLQLVDPATNRVFVLCELEMHERAKALLDRTAIADGIRDMEAGNTQPLDEAFAAIRAELGPTPEQ